MYIYACLFIRFVLDNFVPTKEKEKKIGTLQINHLRFCQPFGLNGKRKSL